MGEALTRSVGRGGYVDDAMAMLLPVLIADGYRLVNATPVVMPRVCGTSIWASPIKVRLEVEDASSEKGVS
jgi:hypothetical protein